MLTSTLLNFRKVFLWLQEQNIQIKSLYKASATVLACVNIIALMTDIYMIVSDNIRDPDGLLPPITLLILLPGKFPLILLILHDPRNTSSLLQYTPT